MAGRRPRGDGSFRRRADGRWEGRLVLEEGGRRVRRSFFGRTLAEARAKMRAAQRQAEAGLPVPSERLTLGAHLQAWLTEKRKTLRPETWRRYGDYVRLYLAPELGGRPLAKLNVDDVQRLHASLVRRGLSGTSAAHVHGVLHAALQDAVRWDLVGRNVAGLVRAPRRSTGEMRFLGPGDARRLLEAVKGDRFEALYVLALTAGLRLGELQALRWRDVDLDRQRLRVVATLTAVTDGAPVFGEPKTQHSRRTVWLSSRAVEALERHREAQAEQRRAAGPAWTDFGLVFTNARGRPLDGSHVLSRYFYPMLEQAGLPRIRFHDLRHTAASLLLAEGVPVKVVSELLGHADVTTTLRIYAHVIEGAQEQAVSAMDRLFHA